MSETKEFITLQNGMRVKSDLFFKKTIKKEESKSFQKLEKQKSDALSKESHKIIAESKPLSELNSDTTSSKIKPSAESSQREVKPTHYNNKLEGQKGSSTNKKSTSKQVKTPKTNKRKRKKKKDSLPLLPEYFIPRNISIGKYALIPSEGYCFKVIDKDAKGIYLDIPNMESQFFSNKNVVQQYIILASSLHLRSLKEVCKNNSEEPYNLLLERVIESEEIIKENGHTLKIFSPMKAILVPDILTETRWELWKSRLDSSLKDAIEVNSKTHRLNKPQHFMVKVHTFSCSKQGHTLQSIQAEIFGRAPNGKSLISKLIPAGYCVQCKRYYILSTIYKENSLFLDHALSKVLLEKDISKFLLDRSKQTYEWATKSVLRECGYSVSYESNLSEQERLNLLNEIICWNILSRQEIMSFLNWLIEFSSTNPKRENAIAKWRKDLSNIFRGAKGDIVTGGVTLIKK